MVKLKEIKSILLVSDEEYFRADNSIRHKGHFIIIKESVCQEDIHILKMSAPNNRASKYIRKKFQGKKKRETKPNL